MIGGHAGFSGFHDAGITQFSVSTGCDTVQCRNRSGGMKTPPRSMHVKTDQWFQPCVFRPFVEVAKDEGGHRFHGIEIRAQGCQLRAARPSEQAQMNADHPDLATLPDDIEDQGTARFHTGQVKRVPILHFKARSKEKRVTMPAYAGLVTTCIGRIHSRLIFNKLCRQGGGTLSQTLVRFLQRDDIRIHPGNDPRSAVRIAAAIQPDAFADIPCGDVKFWHLYQMASCWHCSIERRDPYRENEVV